MKKPVFLNTPERPIFFHHIDNEMEIYQIPQNEEERRKKIASKYAFHNERVPDGQTIRAYRWNLIKETDREDIYELSDEIIEFPINKMYYPFIGKLN